MSVINPICVPCRKEMQCEAIGVTINDPEHGDLESTFWSADRFKCPGCGSEIITNIAEEGAPSHEVPDEDVEESLQFEYA